MFPVPCFAQISSRQHVCVCKGLSVPLRAASKQGSSKLSKAYSPPSNTTLTLETVHGFDTPVGFLPTSLCQRLPGGSSRLCLAFDGETGGRWRPAPHPSSGCHCSGRGDVPQDSGCPAPALPPAADAGMGKTHGWSPPQLAGAGALQHEHPGTPPVPAATQPRLPTQGSRPPKTKPRARLGLFTFCCCTWHQQTSASKT